MTGRTFGKIGALYAITMLLLVTLTGGTLGAFSAQTSSSATITTADDFTADLGSVGNEAFEPSVLRDDGTESELQITYAVPDVRNVTRNESRFTFDFVEHGDPVEATDVECDRTSADGNGTCTVTFDKRDLLMETGSVGDRAFVLRGFWDYNRDFVVDGTIHVEDDGPEPTDDGTESGNTATDDGTESGNTATDDGTESGNTGTCSGNAGNSDCSGDSDVVKHVALPTATVGRSGFSP